MEQASEVNEVTDFLSPGRTDQIDPPSRKALRGDVDEVAALVKTGSTESRRIEMRQAEHERQLATLATSVQGMEANVAQIPQLMQAQQKGV